MVSRKVLHQKHQFYRYALHRNIEFIGKDLNEKKYHSFKSIHFEKKPES